MEDKTDQISVKPQITPKTITESKSKKQIKPNASKVATTKRKNYISQGLPPSKKAPSKLIEMQQAFSEQYYNIPPTNVQKKDNEKPNANAPKTPNNKDNNNNNNNNNLGTLGQIAPLFNVLSGGKNPQIGNLISALGSGNMDMTKMINAMAPSGGAPNLFNMFNNSGSKSVNSKPAEVKPSNLKSSDIKNIKDLRKI